MRRPIKKRNIVEPDLKYQSILVSKLINKIMVAGKKSIATKIVYGAFEIAEKQLKKPAIEILDQALANACPNLELKSRRIGGANYQVPIEVRPERKITLGLRWFVEAVRSGKGKSSDKKLAEEIMNAFNNTGYAVKKKNDMHRMAEANKAFAHFAW